MGTEAAGRFSGVDILTRPGLGHQVDGVHRTFVLFRFFCNALKSIRSFDRATTTCNRNRMRGSRILLLTLASLIGVT